MYRFARSWRSSCICIAVLFGAILIVATSCSDADTPPRKPQPIIPDTLKSRPLPPTKGKLNEPKKSKESRASGGGALDEESQGVSGACEGAWARLSIRVACKRDPSLLERLESDPELLEILLGEQDATVHNTFLASCTKSFHKERIVCYRLLDSMEAIELCEPVPFLLDRGAALLLSIEKKQWELSAYLIDHGAKLNVKDELRCTAMINLSKEKKWDLVGKCLDKGANDMVKCGEHYDGNFGSSPGKNALSHAVQNAQWSLARRIVKAGSRNDVDFADDESSLWDKMRKEGNSDLVDAIKNLGAPSN